MMIKFLKGKLKINKQSIFSLLIVTVISFFTYFKGYSEPSNFFWDENYHISHAQKYLNRIFFMEPHPPLGKLLIALGEYLTNSNAEVNQYIDTDRADHVTKNFSFVGYRLIPVLLGWLTAPLIFLCCLLLTRKNFWALCLSSLYVFDNALIVHSRGAMLEGPQIFFVVLSILAYLLIIRHKGLLFLNSILFGVSIAAVATIKINGLVTLLIVPAIVYEIFNNKTKLRTFIYCSFIPFVFVYIGVWQIHFVIARNINPKLSNFGYYAATNSHKKIIETGATNSLLSWPTMWLDSQKFVKHYEEGVPGLNYCKVQEAGSPAYFWPFGGRTINYRWEHIHDKTRYLFLVSNPAVWLCGLMGVVLALAYIMGAIFFSVKFKLKEQIPLLLFLSMYVSYMAVMLMLERVMYLYHYFLPLIFSFFIFALILKEIQTVLNYKISDKVHNRFFAISLVIIILSFNYYSPLSYYIPISNEELSKRSLLPVWDLRCQGCDYTNKFAKPVGDPRVKPSPSFVISDLKASDGFQDWGEPMQNLTVEEKMIVINGEQYAQGIGVHANSWYKFNLDRRYLSLQGKVGIPDYLEQKAGHPASVQFEIYIDQKLVWQSSVIRPRDKMQEFNLSVQNATNLELKVNDAGDGNNNDHACWVDIHLR